MKTDFNHLILLFSNFYITLSLLSISILFAVEKSLLDRAFFHIMEANLFPENERKVFRLCAAVCVSASKIRMGKDQVTEVARLPEKTAEDNPKEFLSGLPRGSGGITFQLLKER